MVKKNYNTCKSKNKPGYSHNKKNVVTCKRDLPSSDLELRKPLLFT